MKKRVEYKKSVESGWLNSDRAVFLVILIFVLVAVFSVYFIFYTYDKCASERCFFNALNKCSRVEWIRENDKADWGYKVMGKWEEGCKIEIELKKIKQGSINLEDLEGEKMVCEVVNKEAIYPEEDISRCSGRLKEKIQDIIIGKLHDNILQNLGDIKEGFERVG